MTPLSHDATIEREQITEDTYLMLASNMDVSYYRAQLYDLSPTRAVDTLLDGMDLVAHYLHHGWKYGLDPSPHFSSQAYLAANPDVREAGINPLLHYLRYGGLEGRVAESVVGNSAFDETRSFDLPERYVISKHFDAEFYLSQAPDLEDGEDALDHYLRVGWRAGLDPAPSFRTSFYVESNPDVRENGVNPFYHFLSVGQTQGRHALPLDLSSENAVAISLEFDRDFYLRQNPDVKASSIDPLEHYLRHGWLEGRDPCAWFSSNSYLAQNEDVAQSGINPFVHYLVWGRAEKRSVEPHKNDVQAAKDGLIDDPGVPHEQYAIVSASFDGEYYRHTYPDLVDFNGDLVDHYLTIGAREWRNPCPSFSTLNYLSQNPDVRSSGVNPFFHYLRWGVMEGRSGRNEHDMENDRRLAYESERVRSYFDDEYYLSKSPDLIGYKGDLLLHFLSHGWKERRDPSRHFSVAFYLAENPDVRSGGVNPLVHYLEHGRNEGRKALPFSKRLPQFNPDPPMVSVIVPNYNHARFLGRRLDSILNQTYRNIEVIVLDDCSSDASRQIIQLYQNAHQSRIRTIFNDNNSGNVFRQWERGVSAAEGALVWICESDDFCELDFLEKCVRPFADSSVMLSFGRVQFSDVNGSVLTGLDAYRENAEAGSWGNDFVKTACELFRGAFAASNLIPNVGGCVFRNQPIPKNVWDEARSYTILGDWFIYSQVAGGGRLAYVRDAVAYFRQHGGNTSKIAQLKPAYYNEHERVVASLRSRWGTPDDVASRCYQNVFRQFTIANAKRVIGPLASHYSNDRVMLTTRKSRHVLMAFLGFHLGGGELFPIHLANQLIRHGLIVSMFVLSAEKQDDRVRKMLDTRIAVYEADLVAEIGISRFIEDAGVDLIHSHNAGVEHFFFGKPERADLTVPYVVTLHGSYEVTPFADDLMGSILGRVSHWVYLAEKNLFHIPRADPTYRLTQIANGMPVDDREFHLSRQDLGIASSDIVFVIASRAIKEKGWKHAAVALAIAQTKCSDVLHLVLCGSGPEEDALRAHSTKNLRIHVLGFQDRVTGLLRLCDVVLLPSRFEGESFPLCLIQAFHAGLPVIATDIGSVRDMVSADQGASGLIIPFLEDDGLFETSLASAMTEMTNPIRRAELGKNASASAKRFLMEDVATRYSEVYHEAWL